MVEETMFHLRKIHPLQGFMELRYETENCQTHNIDPDDIDELLEHTEYILSNRDDVEYMEDNLPETTGFFYGASGENKYGEAYMYCIREINDIVKEIKDMQNKYGPYELTYAYSCNY